MIWLHLIEIAILLYLWNHTPSDRDMNSIIKWQTEWFVRIEAMLQRLTDDRKECDEGKPANSPHRKAVQGLDKYTCIRTIAFTCPCTADGESTDSELRTALLERIADVEKAGEWQEAAGQEALDVCVEDDA